MGSTRFSPYFAILLSFLIFGVLEFPNGRNSVDGAMAKRKRDYCLTKAEIQKRSKLPSCAKSVDYIGNEGEYVAGVNDNFLIETPDWFDADFASLGQKFGQRNAFGIYYAMFMSFIFFIGDPEIRKVMVNNAHVAHPEGAAKRYLANLLQVEVWLFDDIRGNKTDMLQSLYGVRSRHLRAAYKATMNYTLLSKPSIPTPKKGKNPNKIDLRMWSAFEKDLKNSNLKRERKAYLQRSDPKYLMNQYGMAVAHFLHMGFPIIAPKQVFIPDGTTEEFEAFLHFWAYIGKSVGVEDEFNICLQPNLKVARAHIKRLFFDYMVPSLFHFDYEAKVMFELFFKGLNNAFSSKENPRRYDWNNLGDIFLLRLLEDILQIPATNVRSVLTRFERGSHFVVRSLLSRYKTRTYQNIGSGVFSGLMNLWSNLKFGVDTRNAGDVALRGFVN